MARGQNLFNLGQYTFASYARRGVGNAVLPNGTALVRARIPLNITFNAEVIPQDMELLGPADVANITQNAIVRTAPLDRSFDFEWNMLPYIEFYDEDFLWRYTPDAPVANKIRPWLALVVLKADEFTQIKRPNGALSAIRLQTSALPPAAELHLWAHMHTGEHAKVNVPAPDNNNPLPSATLDDILKQIGKNYLKDPDGFTCRLLSPRRLSSRTLYHAFLIPSFETGRLVGLGEDFSKIPARQTAWTDENRPATLDFPVYHRWTFATSEASFEDLVSKLKAASANPNVGARDMDTSQAGYVKVDGKTPVGKTTPSVLRLEGALRTPTMESTAYIVDGKSDDFQKDVAALLKLYDQMSPATTTQYGVAKMDGDPILTIPLYGHPYCNPKTSPPITRDGTNWYSAINFDPRNRVAAGLGTQVIQKNQEELMQTAWYQLQTLQKARNNFAAVGIIMDRMLLRFKDENLVSNVDFVSMSRNMLPRVKALTTSPNTAQVTVFNKFKVSATPNALINSATRRIMRPGGIVSKRFQLTNSTATATDLKANSSLKVLHTNLSSNNATVLKGYWFRKFDITNSGIVIVSIEIEETQPQETLFDKAFRHFKTRAAIKQPIMGHVFDFANAVKAIFTTISLAPNQLMKLQVKLPVEQTEIPTRPPAELLGQPIFTKPMYEPLWQLDKEWFLPNLNLIENNTVTLLETNTHFINAYMLGVNQEMGREMLWREFPADLSATFFRNFWSADDDNDINTPPRYFDIELIKNWLEMPASPRKSTGQNVRLVLTVRGDLLRKFPNTTIFVANLKRNASGKLEIVQNRDFCFPVFRADLPPDLQFIGFDLSVKQVLEDINGSAWYFVLMEPVGEPRFGLDAVYRPALKGVYNRNDLAWEHVGNGDFLTATQKPTIPKFPDNEKNLWGSDAAGMAAMLFQQPFAQFIKATDLLTIPK